MCTRAHHVQARDAWLSWFEACGLTAARARALNADTSFQAPWERQRWPQHALAAQHAVVLRGVVAERWPATYT